MSEAVQVSGTRYVNPQPNIIPGMYWEQEDGTWILYMGTTEKNSSQYSGYWEADSLSELKASAVYVVGGKSTALINLTKEDTQASEETLKNWFTVGPLQNEGPTITSLRYPEDALIDRESDFVFFQFGKYIPPFSLESDKITQGSSRKVNGVKTSYQQRTYNSSTQLKIEQPMEGVKGIVLPMPQDLGNDIQQTWNGKQFSALGRAAIAGAAAGNLSQIGTRINDVSGNMTSLITSLQTQLLNKIPGVGGNLDMGDITGSTQGIVLNPNAEILYDSPELREIGMTFKMIPRSKTEAIIIKNIVRCFRFASVPDWGGGKAGQLTADETKNIQAVKFTKQTGDRLDEDFNIFDMQNFMKVPFLCKFTFMRGTEVNDKVQQFKPCAIRKVAVNYTSDGTYATYKDGEPVATELTLNFLESKVLFKSDIAAGF